jgi:hypothetical protein
MPEERLPEYARLAALMSVLLGSACASGSGPGARFSGSEDTPVVASWEIGDESVAPEGYEVLGEVTASCTLREGRRTIERERLSDVDCSEARLVRALRESAAEAGGQLLIGRECASRAVRQTAGGRELRVRCSAGVARAETQELGAPQARDAVGSDPGLPPERVELLDEPSAADAWRIRITFTPARAFGEPRPARRGDLVRELAIFPVSHLPLGDLVARCSEGCRAESVRASVRIAAGRLGATDVVGVRCVEKGRGFLCTGTAAAHEVDPETDPRAH